MSKEILASLIFACGIGQLSVLIASALVPLRLNWQKDLLPLARLHRQLFWVYGGYVVLSIVSLAAISLFNSDELAAGSGLARGFCAYVAAFWGIRLCLQAVLDVKEHLRTWWLTLGYHALSVLFVSFTFVFAWAAIVGGR